MKRFGESDRAQILDQLRQGKSVREICRSYDISRTTLYNWKKQQQKEGNLLPRYKKGSDHYRALKKTVKERLIELIYQEPRLSVAGLYKKVIHLGIKTSFKGIQNFLVQQKLNTAKTREDYIKSLPVYQPGIRADFSSEQRFLIIKDIVEGRRSYSSVSRQFGISRTTLYQWVKQYRENKNLETKYREGTSHHKAIAQDKIWEILQFVAQNPEDSAVKLYHKLQKSGFDIGYHGLQKILERYNLNTILSRKIYAAGLEKTTRVAPIPKDQAITLPALDQLSPTVLSQPPPTKVEIYSSTHTSADLRTILYLIFGLSFLTGFFLVSFFLTLAMASSLLQAIGLLLAFMALSAGMIFFGYSLKYYLAVSYLLLFTRKISQHQDMNEDSRQSIPEEIKPGIISDLSQVKLTRHPFVSIHLPLYNEKRVVNRLLEAVTSMDYDNYEVIVADDSTDETKDIVYEWRHHPRIKISHRDSRQGFKGGALRAALKLMDPRTEFVVVFDSDFLPFPDTIEQFLKYFQLAAGTLDFQSPPHPQTRWQPQVSSNIPNPQSSNIAAIQGYQWHVLNKSENWITRGVRTEYAGSYVIERSAAEIYSGLKQIAGSVFMIRADLLRQPQYQWGDSITEDFELTLKLYRDGYKVVYTPYIQAPSECVSTIKRLIRQRMRWAEGHSFNIKKYFTELLFGRWLNTSSSDKDIASLTQGAIDNPVTDLKTSSKSKTPWHNLAHKPSGRWLPSQLTTSEKLEFLYLAPYYLQSGFFILGTLFWFVSEAVFRTTLPFWTEVWGWSLVLTNLLSLPLMNLVGLFLEEAEEKDYGGIPSFLLLTYILAPFQAYAAIKGFLEKEEGPWFRTPKTGKITDVFRKGRLFTWLSRLIPIPNLSVTTPPVQLQLPRKPNLGRSLVTATSQLRSGKKWRVVGRAGLVVVLCLTLLVHWLAYVAPPAQATFNPAWYNTAWQYRTKITIDYTKVSGSANLSNFPVLIDRTDARWKDSANGGHVAQADGDDILFTADDGTTKLSHEIETYTAASGYLRVWVKVSTVSYTANTDIYMYYGNSSASNQQDAAGTWSAYGAVWHLQESSGTRYDATSNNNDLTDNNTVTSNPGKIGTAAQFTAANNEYLSVAQSSSLDISDTTDFTASAWIYADSLPSAAQSRGIVGQADGTFVSGTDEETWNMVVSDVLGTKYANCGVYRQSSGARDSQNNTGVNPTTGTWYYVVCRYDYISSTSRSLAAKVNTTSDSRNIGNTVGNSPDNIEIGRMVSSSSQDWDGRIDEVRIIKSALTDGWIVTEYNNQNSPETFFTSFGTEEEVPELLLWAIPLAAIIPWVTKSKKKGKS